MLTGNQMYKQNSEYPILKSNVLVRQSRYPFSLLAQRLMNYICMMIRPRLKESVDSPYQLRYEFNIVDFCKLTGLKSISGRTYRSIKLALDELTEPTFYLTSYHREPISWLSDVIIPEDKGFVIVELNSKLIPYLFDFSKGRYTLFIYESISGLQSAYGMRLYEILKSYFSARNITLKIETLKKMLMIDTIPSYDSFANFKQRVLDTAINDINEYSDLHIRYRALKEGRKYVNIRFNILRQEDYDSLTYEDRLREELIQSLKEQGLSTAAFEPRAKSMPEKKPRRRKKYPTFADDDDLPF